MRLRLHAKSWGFLAYFLLDGWLALWRPSRFQRGVALVRLDAIGDFVLWLDSAKEFRRAYPGQHIVLIANSAWADLAKKFPYWDQVWLVETHRLVRDIPYRCSFLLKVRRSGFAVVIQPAYSRTFMHGDSVIRATGARERIGSVGDLSNISKPAKNISDRWYTRLVPAIAEPLMELERNAEFIRNLTVGPYRAELPYIPPCDLKAPSVPDGGYFVVFPGASWSGKRWPLESFAKLSAALHLEYGWQLILCGGAADKGLCDTLARNLTVPCINLAGKTSLTELAEIIRTACLLVSNDTSAVHIAAAVGTPTVCILGGGHHGRFMPYPDVLSGVKPLVAEHPMPCFNCNWRCSQPHLDGGAVPCIERVTVEQVLSRVRMALATKSDTF